MKKNLHLKAFLALFSFLIFLQVSASVTHNSYGLNLKTSEEKVITGMVVSDAGETLPGVNVIQKGTTNGTITDSGGNYAITVPDQAAILVFSFLGFETQEIAIFNQSVINVNLKQSIEQLSEVVVIGYGTVRKSDLTGSVSSVTADELRSLPVTSFDQALQGRAAGVQVIQSSGVPGGETNIRIRGTSSVNASSEPLYVIDGMLVNSTGDEMSTNGVGPRIGALSTINPSDIESIEILKDASATAIYGSRGANGVILITTKRGKPGTGTVSFETYSGVQQVSRELDLLNASQFAQLVNDAEKNSGRSPVYPNPGSLGVGTNWQKELFQIAPIADYQLSFTGGTEKTRYAVSGGYFTQDGVVIGSDFNRYSFRVNLDTDVNDRITVGTNLSYNRISSNGVRTGPGDIVPGVVTNALQFNPILPVYDSEVPGGYTFQSDRKDAVANPIADALEFEALTISSRILGNVYTKYKIIEGLEFKTSIGIDGLTSRTNTFGPNFLKRSEGSRGSAVINTLESFTWLNENTFTYNKQINKDHKINVLLGHTLQKFRNEGLTGIAFDFSDNQTGWHNLGAAANPQNPSNRESEWSILSYLGRINYDLKGKYLFTLSGRADGSSKFAKGNKYGFFPSAAFAWRLSDEEFLKGITFISDLKLRASYGVIGNQSIPPFQSLALIAPLGQGVFNVGNQAEVILGREPISYPNFELKWESTKQANIGIDLSVLEDRISLTAEAFQKNTFDLLLFTPIPFTSGFQNTLLNVGNVLNKGVEFDIRSTNTTGKVKWNSSFNISIVRNEITNLARKDDINLGFGGNILREGEPIGSFFGYVFDGIFQTDQEASTSPVLRGQQAKAGDRKYSDISGPQGVPDGIIDEFDRTIIGSAQPDFIWGLNNEFSYKNFSFSFFFQGSQGNEMVNMNLTNLENFNGQQNVLADAGLNRWTSENPSNRYPRALATEIDNSFSSRFVEDASYIRLRSVTLGYNVSAAHIQKIGLRNLRVFANAANLWTLTNYSGYNPEGNAYGATTNIVGVDDGLFPLAKTYTLGIKIGL